MTNSPPATAGKNALSPHSKEDALDLTRRPSGSNLIDYASIPQGEIPVLSTTFSPRDITEKIALQLAQNTRQNKIRIHSYIPVQTPDQFIGDQLILEQIMIRLANNALKHTTEGEIYLSCEVADVYEEAKLAMVRFEVRDTGTGVKSEQIEQIIKPFDSYFDKEKSYAPKRQGLGLSIVERLVQLMGGHIHIESAYRLGSRFWFELPLGLCNATESTSASKPHNHLDGRYVLIIARSESSQFILKSYIKDWKARPIIATDKTEAMSMLRNSLALNEPFYAILIDQDEPEINQGFVEAIRSKRRYDSTPIIVISSREHAYKKITATTPSPIINKQLYYLLNHEVRQLHAHGALPFSPASPESKILLVEQNKLDATIAMTILENLNVRTDHIFDETQLIKQIIDHTYQLILLSIPIAEKDFYDISTVKVVRSWEEHTGQKRLPIIAIAPYLPGIKPVDYLRQFDLDDYISKPIRKDEMLEVVGNCLPHTRTDEVEMTSTVIV